MPKHAPRNAADTRARILASARARFARDSFDHVGTREIAADAGVDASLVNRYFGSKTKLFEEVIDGVFAIGALLPASLADLGEHLCRHVMEPGEPGDPGDPGGTRGPGGPGGTGADGELDALRLLLRASAAPATAALVSARFHTEFVVALARRLRGRDAELRASVIASYVIGLATMKHALDAPALTTAATRKVIATVGAAIQACVVG